MITLPSELKPIAKKVDVKLILVYKTFLILAITNIQPSIKKLLNIKISLCE